ncbi:hypothetical protein [Shewanella fidelis]|uniref:Uncharacterized protein n=1 Tax=Shewanella fidelis TaxID=173509 RepID=A0AAW8NMP5_9GAMM|nr:hypothetical protein [Shewanella fidelis]MDR8523203.1 hypothetical protein [Shewanella fidelis]MDW4811471.1 hypothetical protein [Shewanella fidelis]MDW4815592.1 hypothetical protein [Shewanella fidelis]MDW4819682.1 hypothetical protein [Shewanella fidelis]MDW4824344.1 hypothetical protein [Shewanella fidelis]
MNLIKAAVLISSLMMSLTGYADEWVKVAEKTVNYKTETDKVSVKKAQRQASHIKLVCTQGTVNMHKIELVMADGSDKQVNNLGVLTKGLSSRSISVPEGELKSIELTYDSIGSQTLGVVGATKKGKLEVMVKLKADKD